MGRIIHRLNHIDDRIDKIEETLQNVLGCLKPMAKGLIDVNHKLEKLMALVDDLKTGMEKINKATTKVANRLTELTAQLRDSSLSDAEKTEVLGQIDEIAGHLDEMGQNPTEPVPPEPAALTKGKAKKK